MACHVLRAALFAGALCLPYVQGIALVQRSELEKPADDVIKPADEVDSDFAFNDGGAMRPTEAYKGMIRGRVLKQERDARANKVSWNDKDLVVVPAVYTSWGRKPTVDESGKGTVQFEHQPFWSYEDAQRNRKVFLYQRLFKDLPYFVPNYGYEGAIYLKFVVDHYARLPKVIMFVQDDYEWGGFEDCFSRDSLMYRPLQNHSLNRGPFGPVAEQCWRDFGHIFNIPEFEPRKKLDVYFFPRNNFVVSREQILKRPLSQWQAAYAKATQQYCHSEGPVDFKEVCDEGNVSANGALWDTMKTHDTSGYALEMLSTVIYGFTTPLQKLPPLVLGNAWANETLLCQDFVPSSRCPGSPCQ